MLYFYMIFFEKFILVIKSLSEPLISKIKADSQVDEILVDQVVLKSSSLTNF